MNWKSAGRRMMKKILFVVNTLGCGGAENALLALLKVLQSQYELDLFVLLGQGELVSRLPNPVRLLNESYLPCSVLTKEGRKALVKKGVMAIWAGGFRKQIGYILRNLSPMLSSGQVKWDKLLWRAISDGAQKIDYEYDLAVAWLEGGSAYYTAEHVKARKKVGVVHIDYESAGYTRSLDKDCWESFDHIFAVSPETREHFLTVYPEHTEKAGVLPNLVDQEGIRARAQEPGGFTDSFQGFRLLTVGRLTNQKAIDVAIDAMGLLIKAGYHAKWYVLGEGDQRAALEKKITALGLQDDFILLGTVENPYPFYAQADLYVHATRFEGRSIAIQEAQTLGCPVIASDCRGNRFQIQDGKDGILCQLEPQAIAKGIIDLLKHPETRKRLGIAASQKATAEATQVQSIFRAILEES